MNFDQTLANIKNQKPQAQLGGLGSAFSSWSPFQKNSLQQRIAQQQQIEKLYQRANGEREVLQSPSKSEIQLITSNTAMSSLNQFENFIPNSPNINENNFSFDNNFSTSNFQRSRFNSSGDQNYLLQTEKQCKIPNSSHYSSQNLSTKQVLIDSIQNQFNPAASNCLNIQQQNKLQKPQPIKNFPPLSIMNNDLLLKYTHIKSIIKNNQNTYQQQLSNSDHQDRKASEDDFSQLEISSQSYKGMMDFPNIINTKDHQLDSLMASDGMNICDSSSTSRSRGLSKEQRGEKIRKYWEKKGRRKSQKYVRYECRKNLAEKRFRYQGRFVKMDQIAQLDPELVYNPNFKNDAKTKPIFKVTKHFHNNSLSKEKIRNQNLSQINNEMSIEISSGSIGDNTYLNDISRQADQMNLLTSISPTLKPYQFGQNHCDNLQAFLPGNFVKNQQEHNLGLPGFQLQINGMNHPYCDTNTSQFSSKIPSINKHGIITASSINMKQQFNYQHQIQQSQNERDEDQFYLGERAYDPQFTD